MSSSRETEGSGSRQVLPCASTPGCVVGDPTVFELRMSSPNKDLASGSRQLLSPFACTPGGTASVVVEPAIFEVTPGGALRPLYPAVTPEMASPVEAQKRGASSAGQPVPSKKSRRSLKLSDPEIFNILNDSGSDGDEDCGDESDEEEELLLNEGVTFKSVRNFCRKLRTAYIEEEESELGITGVRHEESVMNVMSESVPNVMNESMPNVMNESVLSESECLTAAAPLDVNFSWSADFSSFVGQKEKYLRVPGPSISSQDPEHIFKIIWDQQIMEKIVVETNLYAWQSIAQRTDPDLGTRIPLHLESWTDVTVGELYRYFAILILMSLCYRSNIREYWTTGLLEMPGFRAIMSRNRFLIIRRFLHFITNADILTRGNNRKIEKIAPIVDHCNKKFRELYTPAQHLSLDESLLLWKGRLSWKQCIRSKAARFGIKSFELCEAETGYLLQYRIYTGKQTPMHPDNLQGFRNHTAKVVLDLVDGYLDVGHILVMDNWYNQLSLTRYLKSRRTDVLGTVNRRRQGMPAAIKELNPKNVKRGTTIERHSGDIALVTWRDVKLVTMMSTYHHPKMVPGRRAGKAVLKPISVEQYNRSMGGVDLKDQKLSMFLMERKRCLKWYLKVFSRLLNISLLNAFIIYSKNPMLKVYSHREFRFKVVEGLLNQYPHERLGPSRTPNSTEPLCVRLQAGNHFPVYTENVSGQRKARKRCARCYVQKKRADVTTICKVCKVPLCIGKCWQEYHTLLELK